MRDTFIKTLLRKTQEDSNIYLLTGDLGFGVFDEFRKKRNKHFINAGVAEQNMTAVATGLALEGNIVFTYSIANFSTLRCLEHIRNDACYHEANVKIVSVGGGFSYGPLGISHHATEDLAIMRSLPNITIFTPSGKWEAEKITEASIRVNGTCYIRLDKSVGDDKPLFDQEVFEIGKARILREGKSCTIFTVGGILDEVQKAAEKLWIDHKIDVRIITFPTIKPIDKEIICDSVKKTENIITVEEHTIHGGLGSIVAEVIMDENCRPLNFLRIALDTGFSSVVGTQKFLRKQYKMDYKSIYQRVYDLLKNNSSFL